jgi:co-chaperonin GroES (HSP10)
MNVVKGKLRPLHDNVLVTDMSFEEQTTASGIVIQSDDGKAHGIKPRWARVWAVGPAQKDVQVGEWICIEHGRWTRGVKVEADGVEIVIRRVEPVSIMLKADEKPNDLYIGEEFNSSPNSNIKPDDFITR